MSKSRSFSIYLLKNGFNANNALNDEHSLQPAEAANLPNGASLFVLDNPPRQPWWKDYFGISMPLSQTTKGALIFLPVGERCFAISFGHVYHHLKDIAYEYDFGLRVTLNCIDSQKLKSTDVVEPGAARRQRTQIPIGSDLTYFDFDRDVSIIKSLTGKVKKEHIPYFSHATGANNLHISSQVESERLPEICSRLLTLYQSEAYKEFFPDIHNISPVKDPQKINELNSALLSALAEKSHDLYLTVPDIINYQENLSVSFSGEGTSQIYEDVFIQHYYQYLEDHQVALGSISIEQLKAHRIKFIDENENQKESYNIFKCLAFDVLVDGQTFHLCDGNWYKVDRDYIGKLQVFLDPWFEDLVLPAYNHATEAQYNEAVSTSDTTFICLDKTNISPPRQNQIEPCDLYKVEDNKAILYHIKVSTRSSQLSHLFNQGLNSAEIIKSEEASRTKLKDLLSSKIGSNNLVVYQQPVDLKKLKVVFGIVTKKNKNSKSLNLPLFSRISLMRSIKALHLMDVHATYCFIPDQTSISAGQRRTRRGRAPVS